MPTFEESFTLAPAPTPASSFEDSFNTFMKQRDAEAGALRASVDTALATPPEKAARHNYLAKATGLPLATVQTAEGEAAAIAKYKELADLSASDPVLRGKLMDPEFTKLAQDDGPSLSAVSKGIKRLLDPSADDRKRTREQISEVGSFLAESAKQLGLGATVGLGAGIQDMAGFGLDMLGGVFSSGQLRDAAAIYRGYATRARESMDYFSRKYEGNVAQGFMSGMQSAGTNLAMLPLGIAAGSEALVGTMATMVGAQSFSKARNKGQGVLDSAIYAAPDAVYEYAFEKVPASRLLADIAKHSTIFTMVKNQLLPEIIGEQATTLLQDLNEWVRLNPQKTVREFIQERPDAAVQTLVATLVGVGVQSGAIRGVQRALNSAAEKEARVRDAEVHANNMLDLLNTAMGSKLRQRDPQTFAGFAQAAADEAGSPLAQVHVDATILADVLKQSGVDLATFAQMSPTAAEALPDALQSGGSVAIPLGDLLGKMGDTGIETALVPHLRASEDALSQEEAKAEQQAAQTLLQNNFTTVVQQAAESQLIEQSAAKVRDAMFEQLQATGRFSADVNRAYAHMVSAFYTVLGQRRGLTPEQAFQKRMLRVQGVGQQTEEDMDQSDAQIGADLQASIESNFEGAVAEYAALPDSEAGRIINADIARELSPAYRADRTRSAAVHEAASAFTKQMYAARLAQPTPAGMQPTVLFTGGGTGAGKSTGLRLLSEASDAEIIYDTNMNTLGSAVTKIEQALAAGRNVSIMYVYRDPVEAMTRGALPRAMRMGRTVPTRSHAETHVGARKVIAQLMDRYANDERVAINVIDNSRGPGKAVLTTIDTIPQVNPENLEETLNAAVQQELQAGRISEAVARGTTGQPQGGGAQTRAGLRGQLEQGNDRPQASLNDFTKENLPGLLDKQGWSILTAADPGATKRSDEENAAANAQLVEDFKAMDVDYLEVVGKYGDTQPSYIAVGLTEDQATELGKKYGQESVLTRRGLVYQDGSVTPATGIDVFDTPPEDFYTEIPGAGVYFSVQLDFDRRLQADEFMQAAVTNIRTGPELFPDVINRLGLSEQEVAATALGFMTGLPGDMAFFTPADKRGMGIPEVVEFLDARRKASGLPQLDITKPEDRAQLARLVAAEALAAINSAGASLEWYDQTIRAMLDTVALKHPELKIDPHARNAFLIATAITSQGLNPVGNLRFALAQYDAFTKDGKFPEVGQGDSSAAMIANFTKANKLMAAFTPAELAQFLVTPFTVKELSVAGFDVSGENMSTQVLGSAVFGPKIGFGFYSNLNGNFEPVTMDMWFMRTFGRLAGTLPDFSPTRYAKQLATFRAGLTERANKRGLYARDFDSAMVEAAMTDDDAALALARVVNSAHQKDFRDNRDKFDRGTREKSTIVAAAATLIQSKDKPKDVPANGTERNHLRDVVAQVVDLVQQHHGRRVPPAALQALIWYPEQELYAALGVKLPVTSTDYADAARQLMQEAGFNDDDINRAAGQSGPTGVRPTAGQRNARANGQAGPGVSGAVPLEGPGRAAAIAKLQSERFGAQRDASDGVDQQEQRRMRQVVDLALLQQRPGEDLQQLDSQRSVHGAGIVFVARDTGRVLLVKRGAKVDNPGTWAPPGGTVDANEQPGAAALREAREEVGFSGRAGVSLLGQTVAGGRTFNTYIAEVPTEFTPSTTSESEGAAWFSRDALPGGLHPGFAELTARAGVTLTPPIVKPGEVTLTGVHFSTRPGMAFLNGQYYGTGLKGAEKERVRNSEDKRLANRTYFYVDEGKGVRPEAGVGGNAHEAQLTNLYDINADPLKLIVGGDTNATETNILNAGFDGYYVSNAFNQQGAAVVIGDASKAIPVTPIANPTTAAPAAPPAAPAVYKRGLLSRELNKLDIDAIKAVAPSARVTGGTFQVLESEREAAAAVAAQQGIDLPVTYAQGKGWRGTYKPSKLTITLLENADLSTFLHETGHFMLDALADAASEVDADVGMREDMDILLKWFGITAATNGKAVDPVEVLRSAFPNRVFTPEELLAIDAEVATGRPAGAAARSLVANVATLADADPQALAKALAGLAQKRDAQSPLDVWNSMNTEAKRPHHEKFAESFEQYLFEGRAPSKELQPLFQRFAAWFERVYQSLQQFMRGHNTQLNDEVRAVFDRMLATREQIEQKQEEMAYTSMFTERPEGMTDEEYADWMMANAMATGTAEDELRSRSLRDLRWVLNARSRELVKLRKGVAEKRKAVEAEVRAEVAQQPVYAVQRWIKTGMMPDGTQTTGALLNTEDLRAIFGDGPAAPWRYLATNMISASRENSLHPDVIAEMFGFQSGDQMVREIVGSFPEEQTVQGMTDNRVLERHGDIASQRAMDDAANAAVHNEYRAKVLASELKAMTQATQPVRILIAAAKTFASQVVGKRKLKDVKPFEHERAEERAAKRGAKATAKGDLTEAAAAKRDQVLQFYSAKASRDALDDIKAARELFDKIVKGGKEDALAKKRDMDLVFAIRAILANYGFGGRAKSAHDYLMVLKEHDPAMFDTIYDRVIAAEQSGKPFNELTVDELRALVDEVKSLWLLSRRTKQIEIDGKLMDLQEAQDALAARVDELGVPDRIPGEGQAVTPAEKRLNMLQTFIAASTRVESWITAKDGGPTGVFRKYIFNTIKDAADAYRADRAEYARRYTELLATIGDTLKRGTISAPELGYTFGKGQGGVGMAELLHAILHTGNASNKRKLLLGRKWATELPDGTLDTTQWDAFVQRMIDEGKLTKAHYDFAQGVWDMLESTKPQAQKMHRDVFGRYFDEVTAEGFVTPFGSYRGGYVPAMADPGAVSDAKTRALAEEENQSLAFAFPTTSKGFTKARVEYNRPLMLDLRTLSSHLDKVLMFSHLEGPVRDVRRLLTGKGVAYALNRQDPVAFDSIITPWLNRTAKQIVETPVVGDAGLMRFFTAARNNAGMAAMFANVSNAAQQITGFSVAATQVPPRLLMSAMASYIAAPRQTADTVAEASPYMAGRMENEVAAMHSTMHDILLDPNVYDKAKAWSRRHAYFLQTAVDNVISPVVWVAARNHALEQGMSPLDARRHADSVVRTTQGSTLPEDVSRIETGNAFVRTFTQFMGYFNMQANLIGAGMVNITRDMGLRNGAGKALMLLTFGALAPAWVAEAIAQAFKGGPDDDDKDGWYIDDWLKAVFGYGTIRTAAAMVPVAGQIVNAAVNALNSKPYDDRIGSSPAIGMIESTVRAVSVYKAIVEDGNKQKAVRDVATAISMITGLPVSAVARPLGYLAGVSANEIKPTGRFGPEADMARGLITGTASPESKR